MKITQLDVPQGTIGEGPVWDVAEQALYWIDILEKKIHRYDAAGGKTKTWNVPDMIGSMAVRDDGGVIAALAGGIHTLDLETGECSLLATHDDLDETVQLADGKVDRKGRFIVGSSDRKMKEPRGKLYSLEAGALREIDNDYFLSNGPCWSPDNKTFYHSDSIRKTIYAYDYDIATGKVANRRAWASTEEFGGIPDGATVDAGGCMWIAICEGGKVVQFTPEGKVERIVEMPVKCPASVIFGGPDLDLLYVPSLSPAFLGREADPLDGSMFVIEGLGVKGIAESRYAG